jgi:hypothetical protein
VDAPRAQHVDRLLATCGVLLAAAGVSGISVAASFAGFFLGMALMLPGHLIGATGAGDVKLFAALARCSAPADRDRVLLYRAGGRCPGRLRRLARRRLRRTLDGTARLIVSASDSVPAIESPLENNRFAYAPAIAVGTMLAALGL